MTEICTAPKEECVYFSHVLTDHVVAVIFTISHYLSVMKINEAFTSVAKPSIWLRYTHKVDQNPFSSTSKFD